MVEVRNSSSEREDTGSDKEFKAREAEKAREDTKTETFSEEEYQRLKEECKLWKERALRYAAEVENLKKSFKREKEEFSKYALEQLFKELLPSIDNLERALEAAEKSNDSKILMEGVALTLKGLLNTMAKFGLTQFEAALGEPFNPYHHEALHLEETDEHPEGTVVRLYQKGYRLHDRIIRPALVAVAKKRKQDQVKE